MRIVMQMKWDGVTPEQYNSMRQSVHWEGNVPQGAVFHVAGFHDNAIHVTDIWESAEDFNNFAQSRLIPGAIKAEIKGQPQVELFPMHAIFIPALERVN